MHWTSYTQSPDQATRFLAASIEHSSIFQLKKIRRAFPEMVRAYLEFSGKEIDEQIPFGPNSIFPNEPEDWRLYFAYPYKIQNNEPFLEGGHWWIHLFNVFSGEKEVYCFTDNRYYAEDSFKVWAANVELALCS